ncbi:hypothetical protein B0J12DRAFT_663361 [Macrophomina phaseolina]|uniref:Uncharacterized protein n=1 Tax=Macrophomina phaseolina TaxID=35725 RepID=A0ABQ8GAP2_9PEZI|nr:hypothetical protein B0J12DRAFT_663361 [Macrophomina phaseolina]
MQKMDFIDMRMCIASPGAVTRPHLYLILPAVTPAATPAIAASVPIAVTVSVAALAAGAVDLDVVNFAADTRAIVVGVALVLATVTVAAPSARALVVAALRALVTEVLEAVLTADTWAVIVVIAGANKIVVTPSPLSRSRHRRPLDGIAELFTLGKLLCSGVGLLNGSKSGAEAGEREENGGETHFDVI